MTAAAGRRPISAELIRAASDIALVTRPELRQFFEALVAPLSESIASLTAAPVRLTFDGLAEASEMLPPSDAEAFNLQTPHGPLDGWLVCDRSLVIGLADVCFGGSGKEPPGDSDERPSSKIETRLRQVLGADALARLPDLFSEALGCAVVQPEAAPDKRKSPEPMPAMALSGRIVFTAFGHSGELRVVFARQPLLKLFQAKSTAEGLTSAQGASPIAAQVSNTEVELRFVLPPQPIMLAELGGLRPGQHIVLAARAADPVQLVSEGVTLFAATMTFAGDRLAFTLTGNPAAS